MLTDEDWAQLESVIDYLEAYEHRTLACEGRYSTAETILPIMKFLLEIFEEGRKTKACGKSISRPLLSGRMGQVDKVLQKDRRVLYICWSCCT